MAKSRDTRKEKKKAKSTAPKESRFGQGFAKVPEELYTKSFEYRLLVRTGKREEAKAGINNQIF